MGIVKVSFVFGILGGYLFTDDAHKSWFGIPIYYVTTRLSIKEKKIHEMMHGNYFGDTSNEKTTPGEKNHQLFLSI